MTGGPIELTLPVRAFDQLVAAVNRAKAGTRSISVSVETIEKLIIDHGRLLRAAPHREPEAPQ